MYHLSFLYFGWHRLQSKRYSAQNQEREERKIKRCACDTRVEKKKGQSEW